LIVAPAGGVAVGTRGIEVGGNGDGVGDAFCVGTSVEGGRAVGVEAVVGETDVGAGSTSSIFSLVGSIVGLDCLMPGELEAGVVSKPTSKVLQAVKNNASRKVRKILSFIGPPMELPRIIDRECHKGVTTALQF
jgi:hypothetical protein